VRVVIPGRMRVALLSLFLVVACAKPYLPLRAENPPLPVAPDGVAVTTGTFVSADGVSLFTRAWRPASGDVRGVLVVMHGLRDHGDHYAGLAATLARRGYALYAFDLRGHGRSPGRRVTVDAFDTYVDDFDRYVAGVRAAEPGKPLFVYGHSMGGTIVGLWATTHAASVDGVILSAPALRIDAPPALAAGTLVAGVLTPDFPGLTPNNDKFSSDPAVKAAMDADPLIYQPGAPVHTARALFRGVEAFWAQLDGLTSPLLLLHGTADSITAPAGSRDLYQRAPAKDKALRLYAGFFHDLVHEPQHDQVFADVAAWLDAHTGGAPTAFAAPDLAQRLPGDGTPLALRLSIDGGWLRGEGEDGYGADLQLRLGFGTGTAYAAGVDAAIGALDGTTYRFAAYPLGYVHGSRLWPGVVDAEVGVAWTKPVGGADAELAASFAGRVTCSLGPVTALLRERVDYVFADERWDWQGLLGIRLGREHHYWATSTAGAGPYLGFTFQTLDLFDADLHVYGLAIGLELDSAN
jgi:acylglycerol lipase